MHVHYQEGGLNDMRSTENSMNLGNKKHVSAFITHQLMLFSCGSAVYDCFREVPKTA